MDQGQPTCNRLTLSLVYREYKDLCVPTVCVLVCETEIGLDMAEGEGGERERERK